MPKRGVRILVSSLSVLFGISVKIRSLLQKNVRRCSMDALVCEHQFRPRGCYTLPKARVRPLTGRLRPSVFGADVHSRVAHPAPDSRDWAWFTQRNETSVLFFRCRDVEAYRHYCGTVGGCSPVAAAQEAARGPLRGLESRARNYAAGAPRLAGRGS